MLKKISKQEIIAFQDSWGSAVVNVGKLFLDKQNYQSAAKELVEKFYAYKEDTVLFKPTRAEYDQFRSDAEGALSYFIGNNPNYTEDTGFALQPWTKVRFENSEIVFVENYALSMGNYFFTDLNGHSKKVEYSMGFFRNDKGELKINLHHSSVPYMHPKHQ